VAAGHEMVPDLPDVEEISSTCFHWRDLLDFFLRAPWEDGVRAAHTSVTEPGLGRRNEASGDECPLFPRELAYHVVALLLPWERRASRREFVGSGKVQE